MRQSYDIATISPQIYAEVLDICVHLNIVDIIGLLSPASLFRHLRGRSWYRQMSFFGVIGFVIERVHGRCTVGSIIDRHRERCMLAENDGYTPLISRLEYYDLFLSLIHI